MTLQELFDDIGEWSPRTFGSDAERGPIGPLKHLAKEVLVELLPRGEAIALVRDVLKTLLETPEVAPDPKCPTELSDVLILFCDAVRRAGWCPDSILIVASSKMAVNKARTWSKPIGDAVSEHVRTPEEIARVNEAFIAGLEEPSPAGERFAAAASEFTRARIREGEEHAAWRQGLFSSMRVLDNPEADLEEPAHGQLEGEFGPR